MPHRRRILQGLSALSIANALPAFAFSSQASAQPAAVKSSQLTGRVELLSERGPELEFAFHVRSATSQMVMRRFQILSSTVRYASGDTHSLVARLPQSEATFAVSFRRVPPPMPSRMVGAGEEVELGHFTTTIDTRLSRGLHVEVHFRFRVGQQTIDVAPIRTAA